MFKLAKAYVEKADKEDGTLDVAIASTGTVDRHGESIDPQGWQLKNFKKNPVLLYGHNVAENRPPIGKVVKIWLEGTGKKAKLMFKPKFDLQDNFAKEIYRKYVEGYMTSFSVGFKPEDWDAGTYLKQELLEISAVPVPANPDAVVIMRQAGITPKDWNGKEIEQETKNEEKPEEEPTTKLDEQKLESPEKETEQPKTQAQSETEQKVETNEPVADEPKATDTLDENPVKEIKKAVKRFEISGKDFSDEDVEGLFAVLNQATNVAIKKLRDSKK